jgi:hypothetical protein
MYTTKSSSKKQIHFKKQSKQNNDNSYSFNNNNFPSLNNNKNINSIIANNNLNFNNNIYKNLYEDDYEEDKQDLKKYNNDNDNDNDNDNYNYKEKLNMIYNSNNDDNDEYNFYKPELGICKIIRNNNNDLQTIIYKNTNHNNYHNQANLIFNYLIQKWKTYNENYIDIHGFDYFEKYHLCDKKYYERSIDDESDVESNYESDNSMNEEEYYY